MRKLFAMLLALCFMCGALTAVAEGTQEVTIGRATFQIPAEMVIVETGEISISAEYEETQLNILAVDWETTYDIDLGSDIPQLMNVYCFYLVNGVESDQASVVASAHTEEDIGMPDKAAVAHLVLDDGATATVLSLGHAYGNYGFLISVIEPTGADQQALLDMGKEIALSFRLDGMTAEEMTAAAEEAAALAAAQKYVVITNSSANIRSGPDGSAAKITTAVKGDTFPLIGEDGNWYIIDVNGQTGYVTKSLSAIKD